MINLFFAKIKEYNENKDYSKKAVIYNNNYILLIYFTDCWHFEPIKIDK
jgi:hypothetical protein